MKTLIQSSLHKLGYHIGKHDLIRSHWLRLIKSLSLHDVTTVLDIGANCGQFGSSLRRFGFKGKIVSFEPIPEENKRLRDRASGDERWAVAPAFALGATDGPVSFNIARNSVASSVLPLAAVGRELDSDFEPSAKITVPCFKLDSVVDGYTGSEDRLFIKLDAQGYEPQILSGATQTLARAVGLQVELSLVPIYDGQIAYREMLDCLASKGFSLWSVDPVSVDPSGRLIEIDGTFFRN